MGLGKCIETMYFHMPFSFVYVKGLSILIGIVFGIIGTIILKKVTSLHENPIA
jgi:hypothetical protein